MESIFRGVDEGIGRDPDTVHVFSTVQCMGIVYTHAGGGVVSYIDSSRVQKANQEREKIAKYVISNKWMGYEYLVGSNRIDMISIHAQTI